MPPVVRKSQARTSLPSKADVLEFINSQKKRVNKRDIARKFKIKGNSKIGLKRLLREMTDEGLIGRTRKRISNSSDLPPVGVLKIIRQTSDGDLVGEPANWDHERGTAPLILFLSPKAQQGEGVAGIGDRVLAGITKLDGNPDGFAYEARIIKKLGEDQTLILGVFKSSPEGGGYIEPIDRKQRNELIVPARDVGDAKTGDLVSVELNRSSSYGPPQVRIKAVLGKIDSHRAASRIAIEVHEIPNEFSPEVIAQANAEKAPGLEGREDLRDIPLITIDPSDARDHDDAVHAQADTSPENPGGFILLVAIADVAAHVTTGSALDVEALERGNSVYFPDRVVPMLPEQLSNDLCSLVPDKDRPALVCRITIDGDGNKLSHEFLRAMIKSHAKLSYQQAQDAIDGKDVADPVDADVLKNVLQPLWQAYAALLKAQKKREPLALDLPERRIVFSSDGNIEAIVRRDRFDAHKLIEEFMIQANVAAAEALQKSSHGFIYRRHDNPSQEKTTGLSDFLKSLDLKLPASEVLRPMHFNRVLTQVKGTEHESLVHQSVLRSQAQAEYCVENYGHFGLNLKHYTHFTSPIRRYADLIVHRALVAMIADDKQPANSTQDLEEVSEHLSMTERRASKAERETMDRILSAYLADKIGAEFAARISGITRSAMFVELTETGADGIIPYSSLRRDRYIANESLYKISGMSSGETFKLGDDVTVRLIEAAPVAGALRFELLSEGVYEKPVRGGRSRNPRGKPKGPRHKRSSKARKPKNK